MSTQGILGNFGCPFFCLRFLSRRSKPNVGASLLAKTEVVAMKMATG
ncbi:hypothetical protein PG5_34960 [Pseudomonas sp. G5(2012)]|nr:hypothetical protein PG5_34960 [Pseudomonas sp. G5(2012)]